MHPELDFHFFEVSAYTFFAYAALLVVVGGTFLFAGKQGFRAKDSLWMLLGMGISTFIGARLFNVLVNFPWYREDLSRIFAFDTRGFSLYGGIAMGMIAGFAISRYRKIPLVKFADTTTPFVGIGIAVWRVGCFLNGCCFGKETALPWGVTFPQFSPAHKHQISENFLDSLTVHPVHPTQIYELLAALFGSILIFFVLRKQKVDGTASLVAAIWFTLFRLINMEFRVLSYSEGITRYFYPLFYIIILVGCVFWLYTIHKSGIGKQKRKHDTLQY